jgi:hypothetical protein
VRRWDEEQYVYCVAWRNIRIKRRKTRYLAVYRVSNTALRLAETNVSVSAGSPTHGARVEKASPEVNDTCKVCVWYK